MKIRNLLHAVTVLVAGQLMFSCNTADYYRFSSAKPDAYNTIKAKKAPAVVEETAPAMALEQAEGNTETAESAPVLEASLATPAPLVTKKDFAKKAPVAVAPVKANKAELSVAEAEALAMAKERLASMSKAEKKALKKEVRTAYRQSATTTSIVEIILAVLLPPLAVFLHDGIGSSFWISIILTLLFFIPGIIYALLVVTDTI